MVFLSDALICSENWRQTAYWRGFAAEMGLIEKSVFPQLTSASRFAMKPLRPCWGVAKW